MDARRGHEGFDDLEESSYFEGEDDEVGDIHTSKPKNKFSVRKQTQNKGGSSLSPSELIKDCEVDPLDEYMGLVDAELSKLNDAGANNGNSGKNGDDSEAFFPDDFGYDNDELLSYIESRRSEAFERASANIDLRRQIATNKDKKDENSFFSNVDDPDSDEEVYTAERFDNEIASQKNPRKPKPLDLPAVDYSNVACASFTKDIYIESDEITSMSHNATVEFKSQLNIQVSGYNVSRPFQQFHQLRQTLEPTVYTRLCKKGYAKPTPVQSQCIPVALKGRDIIGLAETGSGKTLAYALPAIQHALRVLKEWQLVTLPHNQGPMIVILSPTRELAQQIYKEFCSLTKLTSLRLCLMCGGYNKHDQFRSVQGGTEIMCGNPGRIIDLARMKAYDFLSTTMLILDEADRMYNLGFENQVKTICSQIRPERQTVLFSATMPPKIERLVRDVMNNTIRVTIGERGHAASNIIQEVHVVDDDKSKWDWIVTKIFDLVKEGSLLVFCNSKLRAIDLSKLLDAEFENCQTENNEKYSVGFIHGELDLTDRLRTMTRFSKGKLNVLVATDVAARGLDLPVIKTVLNYDMASTIESHVHRIGRTGRAGMLGMAITLVRKCDSRLAANLVENLETADQTVPKKLLALAMTHAPFKKARGKGEKMWRKKGPTMNGSTTSGIGYATSIDSEVNDQEAILNASRRRWDTPLAPGRLESTATATTFLGTTDANDVGSSGARVIGPNDQLSSSDEEPCSAGTKTKACSYFSTKSNASNYLGDNRVVTTNSSIDAVKQTLLQRAAAAAASITCKRTEQKVGAEELSAAGETLTGRNRNRRSGWDVSKEDLRLSHQALSTSRRSRSRSR